MRNGARRRWAFVLGQRQIGMRSDSRPKIQQNAVTDNDRRHQTEARPRRLVPLLRGDGVGKRRYNGGKAIGNGLCPSSCIGGCIHQQRPSALTYQVVQ